MYSMDVLCFLLTEKTNFSSSDLDVKKAIDDVYDVTWVQISMLQRQ